ncbi:MAG: type II secretion system protein [Nitrospirae bacterium]|nr:type II secretion system protein [Nitrospirota bacterium]MBI5695036.1 type II secretion system protein [Nitrospirota bacterium]
MLRWLHSKKGMTFVELVVVMAVMSILASVAMPMLRVSVKRAKEMELKRSLREMRDAVDRYKKLYEENRITREAGGSGYPKTLDVLVEGVEITNTAAAKPGEVQLPTRVRLLRKIPVDPMTGSAEWGLRSNEDDPESRIWGGQDVFDVYSLDDGTALDGTKYSDW